MQRYGGEQKILQKLSAATEFIVSGTGSGM